MRSKHFIRMQPPPSPTRESRVEEWARLHPNVALPQQRQAACSDGKALPQRYEAPQLPLHSLLPPSAAGLAAEESVQEMAADLTAVLIKNSTEEAWGVFGLGNRATPAWVPAGSWAQLCSSGSIRPRDRPPAKTTLVFELRARSAPPSPAEPPPPGSPMEQLQVCNNTRTLILDGKPVNRGANFSVPLFTDGCTFEVDDGQVQLRVSSGGLPCCRQEQVSAIWSTYSRSLSLCLRKFQGLGGLITAPPPSLLCID